jgi:DNA polymerase III epsilon subunit family exonuclease
MEVIIFVGIGWLVLRFAKVAIRNFSRTYDVGSSGGSGFAVIDFETSGLSPAEGARVIQVAVVLLDRSGKTESSWNQLVNPMGDVGPTYIHGITNDMVRNAPKFQDIADHLLTMIQGRVLVAHNARFDLSFLFEEMKRSGQQLDLSRFLVFDTMTNADKFFAFLPNKKMETCVAMAGINLSRLPGKGFHDAEFDTAAEAALLAYYLRTDRAQVSRNTVLASNLKLSLVEDSRRDAIDDFARRNNENLEYVEISKIADLSQIALSKGDEIVFVNVTGNEFDRLHRWSKVNALVVGERITKSRTKLVVVGSSGFVSLSISQAVKYQLPVVPSSRLDEISVRD